MIVAREFKRGDADAAFAAAPVRIGGRFRMHRKSPVAIEPRACVAEYEPGRDALTLHSATQVPGIVRDALVLAFDMPAERIRVIAPDVGGGFGAKGSLYPEEIFVCAAARQLRRPVKWTSDRLEDLAANSQAFDEIVDAELALDGEGRIAGLRADVIGDVRPFCVLIPVAPEAVDGGIQNLGSPGALVARTAVTRPAGCPLAPTIRALIRTHVRNTVPWAGAK